MKYAGYLRELFSGVDLAAEDLLFLEPFQIESLPDRAPRRELAVLLKAHPVVERYFAAICPSIRPFLDDILNSDDSDQKPVEACSDDCLWEIADLIIYGKHPDVYDAKVEFAWALDEIVDPKDLAGKVVVDAGAGPGKLSFLLAPHAGAVFAMEPVGGFRRFMKSKIRSGGCGNVYPIDGVLDDIPLPDESIDYLFTSQAIGWNLEGELREIERILKPDGSAVHLLKDAGDEEIRGLHEVLTSSEWDYRCERFPDASGPRLKYVKRMHSKSE